MNTIQSLLHDVKVEMAVPAADPTLTAPARPLPDDRLWPADLAAILDNNPHAVRSAGHSRSSGSGRAGMVRVGSAAGAAISTLTSCSKLWIVFMLLPPVAAGITGTSLARQAR